MIWKEGGVDVGRDHPGLIPTRDQRKAKGQIDPRSEQGTKKVIGQEPGSRQGLKEVHVEVRRNIEPT